MSIPSLAAVLREDPAFLDSLSIFDLDDLAFTFYIQASATPDEYIAYQSDKAELFRQNILSTRLRCRHSARSPETKTFGRACISLRSPMPACCVRKIKLPRCVCNQSLSAHWPISIPRGDTRRRVLCVGDTSALSAFFEQVRVYGTIPTRLVPKGYPIATTTNCAFHIPRITPRFALMSARISTSPKFTRRRRTLLVCSCGGSVKLLARVTGPSGVGDQNFVPQNTPLPYRVEVRQPTDAASYVNQLRVVLALDPSVDVRTYAISDLKLGDLEIDLPNDRVHSPASSISQPVAASCCK